MCTSRRGRQEHDHLTSHGLNVIIQLQEYPMPWFGVCPHHRGHLWGMAQGLAGRPQQAWEASCTPDREGGGGDSETIASAGGNSFGAR